MHKTLYHKVKFLLEAKLIPKLQSNHLVVVFLTVVSGKVYHTMVPKIIEHSLNLVNDFWFIRGCVNAPEL